MKILVVDDEQDVKILFQQRFRKEIRAGKIDFRFAFSGEDGLRYLEQNGTTDLVLILSDINMPGMNGLEMLKNIKQKYDDTRVIMITAYGNDDYRRQANQYGCEDYIIKPIDFDDLRQRILAEGDKSNQ
jgi:two-component system chemotaxis response regulator CheY